jgi:hypothetical protein
MRSEGELRRYQQRIATWLFEHNEAICVARPGGGKTISALTAVVDLLHEGVIRHALIIAPKRVARMVWPDEIASWAHTSGLRHAVLDGNGAERAVALMLAPQRELTIVGIDVAQWLVDALRDYPPEHPLFDLLVIDEVSRLRNPKSKRAQALAKIADRWRMLWGLSGTLRPSSALDLFMPTRVVTRGKLWGRSFYGWRKEYFYPTDYNGYDWQPLPGSEDKLNAAIAPLTVALADGDMPDMPALSVVIDKVTLSPEAYFAYDSMERKLIVREDNQDILAASAAVATGKLAQIANGFIYDEACEAVWQHNVKREWLTDLVEEATAPMLLVYEFLPDLAMFIDVCWKHSGYVLPCLGVGGGDDDMIRDWNAGKLPFLALHPASGGHGLNLQHGGADMAWIAPTWSPELWEQTIARLHRPGQTRPVVVRVCVAADTVDELKLARVHLKLSAQEAFEQYLRRLFPSAAGLHRAV